MITKVAAYIFRRGTSQNKLLVFAHRDYPDVPIQVPGGTVEDGEEVIAAVVREVEEEAGLKDLTLVRKLGSCRFHQQETNDEVERHFFLLEVPAHIPDAWEHEVRGDGVDCGLLFAYSWVKVDDALTLAGDLGKFLNREEVPELYI